MLHDGFIPGASARRSNYMFLNCFEDNADWAAYCQWKKVIDGKEQDIPGAGFDIERDGIYLLRLEVEGQQYRAFVNGQPKFVLRTIPLVMVGLGLNRASRTDGKF